MADLKITEYRDLARDANGNVVPVGLEPAITIQTVSIGVGSAQSDVLNAETRFVHLEGDGAGYFLFSTNPTVTNANGQRLVANSEIYRGVQKGLKIAVKDAA